MQGKTNCKRTLQVTFLTFYEYKNIYKKEHFSYIFHILIIQKYLSKFYLNA